MFAYRMILGLLGCLIVIATSREIWKLVQMQQKIDSENDGLSLCILHCFSVVSNARKLLSTKIASKKNNLGCLHGIRFLSATWVVMGHIWYQATFQPTYSRSVLLKVKITNLYFVKFAINLVSDRMATSGQCKELQVELLL